MDIESTHTSSLSTRKDPRALTNLSEILSCLSSFQYEEAELSDSLSQLLKDKEPVIASLDRLQSLNTPFNDLQLDANLLSAKVSNTAKTAERIGSKVRSLDEEMGRVREAGDRAGQVMELKSSLLDLQKSMDTQDWESAARHCARAMSLPAEVVSGPFAGVAVPTTESHLPPAQTLQLARETLLSVFRERFLEASRVRDSSATSRFFKLFPAIGWENEGLDAYSDFVVELVRARSPAANKASSPLYYVTALTSLFESIAMIVDQHQPVVEKYYGPGKMKPVVRRLLEESDKVTRNLSNSWQEDRSITRKLAELVANPPVPMFSSHMRKTMEDESIDPREIDKIISEIAGMVGRWSLFRKFILEALEEDVSKGEDMLSQTDSNTVFDNLVTVYYIPMEMWYTRTIIDKAHRLSSPDLSQNPVTTTTPDDVFYILKSVTTRLLTTGSLKAVERTIQQVQDVIDRDYIAVLKRRLDEVYKNQPPATSTMRSDRLERENRVTFITLLNDFDVSASHLERLLRDLIDSPVIYQHFREAEQQMVKDDISKLFALTGRLKGSLRAGIEQLFNQLLRPKLRNLIPDVYKDVSYVLDEDGYAAAEYQDVVRKRFIKGWETLVDGYKDTFSDTNYRLFFGLALDFLLKPWEKFVMNLKYSELGAVRFDRDLRAIITYLASQTAFGDIREKFLRLQQISTLLNLDADEDVDEFYNGSGISWKIGPHEARAIASLKI
ncbi:COG4-domain-containing protein [Agrocybe pediades]|nr:COG4-domain-containing protein [Agrocybe pediades]